MKDNNTMNRRKFLKLSAAGVVTAGAGAWALNAYRMFGITDAMENNSLTVRQDAKHVFSTCGACSTTLFTLLNREFGCPKRTEELAADPLAGGLMNTQQQCGMVWGATLATGAESFRRYSNGEQATTMAMIGARHVVESFVHRTRSPNCRDVIGIDIANSSEVIGFMIPSLPGGFQNMLCMNVVDKWFPEAVAAAREGLADRPAVLPQAPKSCASEVARRMGASDEEVVTVAGFAGGIGLSGYGCGALGAAIWLSSLAWCREHPGESGYLNPGSQEILNAFKDTTGSEMLCSRIAERNFTSVEDHTEFIENGGCDELIDQLAQVSWLPQVSEENGQDGDT